MKKAVSLMLILFLLVPAAQCAALRPQGSAGFLEGVNLLACVFVDCEPGWDENARSYVLYALETSAEYLENAGAACGKSVRLITGADHEDLQFTFRYPRALRDSHSNEDRFDEKVLDYINDKVPARSLMDRYGASGIGYLVFLPGEGASYSMIYYEDDDEYYYPEYCVFYAYDSSAPGEYESVAVFAHEILHLFGAVDLYETNPSDGVTHELVEFVVDRFPDELMYYTYEDDDSTNTRTITRTLSEITLYLVGLVDDTQYVRQFPTLRRANPCAFRDEEPEDLSEYYCLKKDCPYCGGWPRDDY